ncbi:putative inactive tRNA-specific adenosine deaminase-like protein 3 isoform X2 [Senna tora]|uniref:Putative inactive tRNA-specific adenosine deaminase-like protein 3 isoform X2 n=1 Tax=Senna tora TaxID=362788 RepID=A0A834TM73_9FABA|nr:putative inactive tRNA-specific adenosine deaminase-like protein 3 isoform X2 [Senna tora]
MSCIGVSIVQLFARTEHLAQEIQYFHSSEKLRSLIIVSGYYNKEKNFKREILVSAESLKLLESLIFFFDFNASRLPLKSLDLPENVIASFIDPKNANQIIRRLNQIEPLENLRHVKRVQKKILEEGLMVCRPCIYVLFWNSCFCYIVQLLTLEIYVTGQIHLSVILCLASEGDNQLDSIPPHLQELISFYQLSPFITKVCKYAATSKEEWQEQCKFWPTSYHPRTYTDSCCFRKPELSSSHPVSDIVAPNDPLHLNSSFDELKQPHMGVACLYPWLWAEQQSLAQGLSNWHPLRHAAIVAIESSAARDRLLFPSMGNNEEKYLELDHEKSSCTSSPAKRLRTIPENVDDNEKVNAVSQSSEQLSERPYLCTGYDIFLVWEPCAMCAMALVHQRIRRIFYAFPNPNAGALGSVHRLQGEKSLNHHYAVFRVLLPQQVLHKPDVEVAEIK